MNMMENETPEPVEETEEKRPDGSPFVGKVDAPMTADEFSTNMDQLFDKARSAGLRPLQAMASTYIRAGVAMIDGLLATLGGDDQKKPPPEDKK